MKLTKTISPTPLTLRRSCVQPCLQAGAVTIKPIPVVLVKDKLKIDFELKLNVPNVNTVVNVNVWQHVAPITRIGAVFDEDFGLNPMCSPAHRQFLSPENQRYFYSSQVVFTHFHKLEVIPDA